MRPQIVDGDRAVSSMTCWSVSRRIRVGPVFLFILILQSGAPQPTSTHVDLVLLVYPMGSRERLTDAGSCEDQRRPRGSVRGARSGARGHDQGRSRARRVEGSPRWAGRKEPRQRRLGRPVPEDGPWPCRKRQSAPAAVRSGEFRKCRPRHTPGIGRAPTSSAQVSETHGTRSGIATICEGRERGAPSGPSHPTTATI